MEAEVKQVEPPQSPKSVEQNMKDLLDAKKRNLDQWCFAEHLEPAVLLQVIIFITVAFEDTKEFNTALA